LTIVIVIFRLLTSKEFDYDGSNYNFKIKPILKLKKLEGRCKGRKLSTSLYTKPHLSNFIKKNKSVHKKKIYIVKIKHKAKEMIRIIGEQPMIEPYKLT